MSEESKPKKSKKKVIFIVLFVIFNVLVIGYTALKEFTKERPPSLHINFTWIGTIMIVCAFLCALVAMFIEAAKYMLMMRSLKQKISFKVAFQTAIIGKYYDNITPSGVGGQPSQILFMHRMGYPSGASAAMPLSGFFAMQSGFIILAVICFLVNGRVLNTIPAFKVTAWAGILSYAVFPVMILLTAFSHKTATKIINFFVDLLAKIRIFKNPEEKKKSVTKSLEEYALGIKKITSERYLLLKLLLLSVIYQAAICSIPFFVLHAFGGNLPYFDVLTMTLFIYAAITFIPTPGNSGAAEASFYLVFNDLSEGGVFWAMLIWRFVCYYFYIIMGIGVYGYNAWTDRKKKKQAASGPDIIESIKTAEETDFPDSPETMKESLETIESEAIKENATD